MEILERLSNKVHLVSDELISLKKEKRQLLSELELLRNQSYQFYSLVKEIEQMKKDRERLRSKLLKTQRKIERLLVMQTPVMSLLKEEYADEKHPQ